MGEESLKCSLFVSDFAKRENRHEFHSLRRNERMVRMKRLLMFVIVIVTEKSMCIKI